MTIKSSIVSVDAFRIWDSRGRPTVEAEVTLADGTVGRGIAPAGASRGANEALDLRDGGTELDGFGVNAAIRNVREVLGPAIKGLDATEQAIVDARLVDQDKSPNRETLGGNALIATSMAVLRAAAQFVGEDLWRYVAVGEPGSMPMPEIQIFGGGAHAGGRVDVQDFLVMPVGAETFDEALYICAEIYATAGKLMEERGCRFGVADEGGWWPAFDSNEDALTSLTKAIELAGFGGGRAMISLDVAASQFYTDGYYTLQAENRTLDVDEWLDVLHTWVDRYPIVSIEDPVAEHDTSAMQRITAAIGGTLQIVGDDYLVTSAERVSRAIQDASCNAVLIKPNQVGTITEAHETLRRAQAAGWGTLVSARSGETEDVMITHLAVGWQAGQLKVGSFSRSERMAKWNEGLRIERQTPDTPVFSGIRGLPEGVRGALRLGK